MCGIYCHITCNKAEQCNSIYFSAKQQIMGYLKNRGPDGFSEYAVHVEDMWSLNFASCVLWMQGQQPVLQPTIDAKNSVLVWNGDIFGGPLETDSSDTLNLSNSLSENRDVLSVLESIEGPFSFVYYDAECRHLYFGRDRLGRHSLLWSYDSDGHIILTSVAKQNLLYFREVPALGIFKLDLNVQGLDCITLFPWADVPEEEIIKNSMTFPLSVEISSATLTSPIRSVECGPTLTEDYIMNNFGNNLEDIMEKLQSSEMKTSIEKLLGILRNSVRLRVEKQPGFCKNCIKSRSSRDVGLPGVSEDLRIRHENKMGNIDESCKHSKVGILFSGGLDSALLAALAHEFVPCDEPIDLLNVAFEKLDKKLDVKGKRAKRRSEMEPSANNYLVADRVTGTEALKNLKSLYPDRQWNFVEINVTQGELENERNKTISHLIHPLNTVLDDSLGCAMWFASRGDGSLRNEDGSLTHYITPVRVLLLGIGADELFGGYIRHRVALKAEGWLGLRNELDRDFLRISTRNLGRDNRIVCDHSCQPRLPYLDETVVSFACSLQPWERCYPVEEFPPGVGDKLLLRLVAWKIGLHYSAKLRKRAIQFGSRIANSKEKGSNVSERLCRN